MAGHHKDAMSSYRWVPEKTGFNTGWLNMASEAGTLPQRAVSSGGYALDNHLEGLCGHLGHKVKLRIPLAVQHPQAAQCLEPFLLIGRFRGLQWHR